MGRGNDTSNTVTITVDPPVVGGTVSGTATVCEGSIRKSFARW